MLLKSLFFKSAAATPAASQSALLMRQQFLYGSLFASQRFFSAPVAQESSIQKTVELYQRKRNAFYKLGYNENHIPNQ